MYRHKCLLLAIFLFVAACDGALKNPKTESKCKVPSTAPRNIEKAIRMCQEEISLQILTEAFESLQSDKSENTAAVTGAAAERLKRDVSFNPEEKRIAGCLLQCVYRKRNALDRSGYPTIQGLVALYTEGVTDREYFQATVQSVQVCLGAVQKKYYTGLESNKGKGCDISYDVFDCVAEKIAEFCGQSP